MTSVKEILEHLNQVFEVNDLIPRFTLGGIEYGFITQLDEMTLGEYIDLDENMRIGKPCTKQWQFYIDQ